MEGLDADVVYLEHLMKQLALFKTVLQLPDCIEEYEASTESFFTSSQRMQRQIEEVVNHLQSDYFDISDEAIQRTFSYFYFLLEIDTKLSLRVSCDCDNLLKNTINLLCSSIKECFNNYDRPCENKISSGLKQLSKLELISQSLEKIRNSKYLCSFNSALTNALTFLDNGRVHFQLFIEKQIFTQSAHYLNIFKLYAHCQVV